jgi:predicted dehydrogenase
MRQILLNSQGAVVARMPRPMIEPGTILVRVRYSLISTGTELASLRPQPAVGETDAGSRAKLAISYLGKAARDPAKATQRLAAIARKAIANVLPESPRPAMPVMTSADFHWTKCSATEFEANQGVLSLATDNSEFGYQAMSQKIAVEPGMIPIIELEGEVTEGMVSIGLLDENHVQWLGSRIYDKGCFQDRLIFSPGESNTVTLVIANGGSKEMSRVRIANVQVLMAPPMENGLPQSELGDQGWNVGYSAAGEIVAVGEGVEGFSIGDLVACSGAGKANHADYVCVPRNLVCRIPPGCDLRLAATTTVGTIALQGVRRAAPRIGETACVLGLGLIGQMTVQILRANGVRVIGLDLDQTRVARAMELGMEAGTSDPDNFKLLVRDFTKGRGGDQVLITAATKSDSPINLAMEVARAKGVVIIVGDIGLNAKREVFYRKEIDLLMSTSYGPGRYDREYEEGGHDYPFGYVRWTLNRNMQAYMDLIADGRLNLLPLIEREVDVSEAAEAYRDLAAMEGAAPLAVLLSYPDDTRLLPEAPDAAKISVRGHRKVPNGVARYALVGAGAFGTSMLVPQMAKRKDRFFLRGVVSRNTTTAGNFARTNQVEVLTTDLGEVLEDSGFDLLVIATRHHEHADQAIRVMEAGKHVFVEKPLAITWEQLDRVASCYEALPEKPLLMVGFNRRFSPALQRLKQTIAERRSPLIINYRLNGGYIPTDHWIQGAHGGGRNIGEACHMYDVFRFLAGKSVAGISARAIDPGSLPYLRTDNFCATLAYEDGSVGNLVYTALGPKQGLPKERIEVFCDGEAYIVDDFKSLVRASDSEMIWHSNVVDKGHFEQLSRFGDAIANGLEAPIAFGEIMETSAVALHIDDMLNGRQASV